MITEKCSYSGYIDPLSTKIPHKIASRSSNTVKEDFSTFFITLTKLHVAELSNGGQERPEREDRCLRNTEEAYNYYIKSMRTRTAHILKRYVPYQKPSLSAYNAPPRGASEMLQKFPIPRAS